MRRIALAVSLSLGLILAACGDDDEAVSKPKPPPTLAFASVTSAGGPLWTPASSENCVELGSDPAQTLVFAVTATDFTLRPPGACGSLRPCGVAVLFMDDVEVARAGTANISLPFANAEGGLGTGQRSFRVELRDHLGEVVLGAEQQVISAEVALDVRAPGGCVPDLDGGSDAPSDAPPDSPEDAGSDAEAGTDAQSDASDAASDAPGADASADAASD